MELYIKDYKTFETLGILTPIKTNGKLDFTINLDEQRTNDSTFKIVDNPIARENNFLIVSGLDKQYMFIITKVEKVVDSHVATITAKHISTLFDKKVFEVEQGNKSLEKFIADLIDINFIHSDDDLMNLKYIDLYLKTNTAVVEKPDVEEKLFNLHTFIINCEQHKRIKTHFKIKGNRLAVEIENVQEKPMININADLIEIVNAETTNDTNIITKVEAYDRTTGKKYSLFLRDDRTTTEDKNDSKRLFGKTEVISSESIEKAKTEALDRFKGNRYNHLFEFKIPYNSKLVDVKNLELGDKIKIKIDNNIYESYISSLSIEDSNLLKVKTGNLKVLLTDKLKALKKVTYNITNGITTNANKLDVSGGNITGNLTVQGSPVLTQANVNEYIRTPKDKINVMFGLNGADVRQEQYNIFFNETPVYTNNKNFSDFFTVTGDRITFKKAIRLKVSSTVFINGNSGYLFVNINRYNAKENKGELIANAIDDGRGDFKSITTLPQYVEFGAGDYVYIRLEVPGASGSRWYHLRGTPSTVLSFEEY